MKALAVLGLGLVAAFPAMAGDIGPARPRLVTGSIAPAFAPSDTRAELFATGGFSIGTVGGTPANSEQPLMVGAFAGYSFEALRLSSSLKGNTAGSIADFTASYSGAVMGIDGVTALKLGYEKSRPLAFSPNPVQAGLVGNDAWRPEGDLSLSLSFTHDFNSSMSLGGFAAATRSDEEDSVHSGFRLGAGLGLRF